MMVRVLTWVVVAAALALAFTAWRDPQLALTLANQVWACF